MVSNVSFRATPNLFKSVASLESPSVPKPATSPLSSTFSATRESWSTDKVSADKSSPLEDSNSLDTWSRFSEALKQAKSNLFSKKRMSARSSLRAVWARPTPVKLEDSPSLISRDTKSLFSRENSPNSPELSQIKRNDPSYLKWPNCELHD